MWMWGGLAVGAVAGWILYRKSRRVSHIEDLPRRCYGKRLSGVVTGVPDGDGFRFFHTPWFRRRTHGPGDGKLYVRLAGIDAPEVRHFHVPEQPFAKESREYLKRLVLNKGVHIKIVGVDRYNRVLAIVHLPGWICRTNVNLEMVEKGYACVYTGKDAVYDGYEDELRSLESAAIQRKSGMWKTGAVTPMEHKRMYREQRLPE